MFQINEGIQVKLGTSHSLVARAAVMEIMDTRFSVIFGLVTNFFPSVCNNEIKNLMKSVKMLKKMIEILLNCTPHIYF